MKAHSRFIEKFRNELFVTHNLKGRVLSRRQNLAKQFEIVLISLRGFLALFQEEMTHAKSFCTNLALDMWVRSRNIVLSVVQKE